MSTFRLLSFSLFTGTFALLGGCRFVDDAIMSSGDGRYALSRAEYNLAAYYRNVYSITPAGDFRVEETGPEEKVVLLLHGFGTGDGVWGNLADGNSPLSVACEVFEGRVLLANYPSTDGIDVIASGLCAELEKLQVKCGGELPRLSVFAHSMGGSVARAMVRKKPGCFREVALVGSPNTGLRFGIMTAYFFRYYYRYYEELLLRHGISTRESGPGDARDRLAGAASGSGRGGGRTSMDDLSPRCGFMRKINSGNGTTGPALDVTYHFFVFRRTGANNMFIPGRDDSLISPGSAYPLSRIRRGEFENVRLGTVECFRGDVNHYTLIYNPDIVRAILLVLKMGGDTPATSSPKKRGEIEHVRIRNAPPCEVEQRKKIAQTVVRQWD